jgi:hypothetical protein
MELVQELLQGGAFRINKTKCIRLRLEGIVGQL